MQRPETIWIIGASDGIGAALAREWSKRGVRLILSARRSEPLEELAASLGPDHIALPLDVSDRKSLDEAAQKISNHVPLDRVVHLAAMYDPGKVMDIDPESAAKLVTVNLTGTLNVAQVATPLLKEGGQLALCGSIAGYIGLPQGQIYSATKAAVINFTESLRVELANSRDVRLINPGFVDTRMTQRNDFDMPAMVTPEVAARAIVDGLHSNAFEIHFPRRLTYALKLLSILPYWAALPLTRRLTSG
ncbi:SDR family NAD(P)-dependent oxidoreductase [Gymnodinialimonas ceratoperidinii]|uniref:SDR family NAD(P)-dependent oxidoreductase n=1 Tax=Gymnodinialimonas ceratoperidinii TaxID=2856823 RepID=A0A8F6TWS9_9RHOB|nr:SDR family NAD(P)-dependent oxidoreductase [Gymnodinialimonas ceratoperidinii]QXT40100.1 SDR family NAD(P)-dependent oxidoreductase [Gymnodinialimonas ceratoperidinii]